MDRDRHKICNLLHPQEKLGPLCKILPWLFGIGIFVWLSVGFIAYPVRLGCYVSMNPSRAVWTYKRQGTPEAVIKEALVNGRSNFAEMLVIWPHCRKMGYELMWPVVDEKKARALQEAYERSHP